MPVNLYYNSEFADFNRSAKNTLVKVRLFSCAEPDSDVRAVVRPT